ncbi:MAG: antibiotic biosynthesis monooxygenase family protein [bacterium]
MAIRVLIRREIEPAYAAQLHQTLLRLRARAMRQRGYISGETLRSLENPDEFLVISTWDKLEDWTLWENNPERRQIQEEIAGCLRRPEETTLYGYS